MIKSEFAVSNTDATDVTIARIRAAQRAMDGC